MVKVGKEKFFSTVAKAFQEGKKDPESGLKRRFRPEMGEIWRESYRMQQRGETVNRYAPDYKKPDKA